MLLILVLVCIFGLCCSQGAPEPKYVLVFESPMYVCAGDDVVDTAGVLVQAYNESVAFMHGEIHFKQTLDHMSLEIILQKEVSGQWEVMFSHDVCDFCAEVADTDSAYYKYLQFFGFPSTCPFEKGSYPIHNFVLDLDEIPMSSQHEGKYLAELNMFRRTGDDCRARDLLYTAKMDLAIEHD